jgi:23S rRNA pseudouridine1911/1915/1917 synthase
LIQNSDKRKSKTETELTVTENTALLDFLLLKLTKLSRNNVKSLLKNKEVLVDGRTVTRHDHPLKAGQKIRIIRSVVRGKSSKPLPKILFEDKDLLVIDKPAGLLSIAADNKDEPTAYNLMREYVRGADTSSRIFIVHRLDRDTSGVLLFAKNEEMKKALQDNWDTLVSLRGYAAVVEGRLSEKSGRIRTWLRETKTLLVYSAEKEGDGLEAITNYRVTEESSGYSLLSVELETGRKNQIRVHMKELGHPVAGDTKYGANTNPLKRLGLHANVLELKHPFTNQLLHFESEIPGSFKALLQNGR